MIYKVEDLFLHIRNGMSIKQASDAGGLPITRIETIADTEINLDRVGFAGVNEELAKHFLLEEGEILFSHINSVSHIGKCALYKKEYGRLVHGMNLLSFKPNEKIIYPKFALYSLRSQQFRGQLAKSIKKSVNQASVSISDIKKITLRIPPLAEQQRIAAILDKAEEIRRKRLQAIAKLDKLSESCYKSLFDTNETNKKSFKKQKLTEFFKFKTGKLDSNASVANGQYPFFTCAREDFAINEYAFDEEALLLAGNNATADYSVKHFVGKFNAYQRTYVINLKDEENSYLFAKYSLQLMLNKLKNSSKGSGTKYLTMGIFNNLEIIVPPIDLQNEFDHSITSIEKIKNKAEGKLKLISLLIASLQHQAFTTGFNA